FGPGSPFRAAHHHALRLRTRWWPGSCGHRPADSPVVVPTASLRWCPSFHRGRARVAGGAPLGRPRWLMANTPLADDPGWEAQGATQSPSDSPLLGPKRTRYAAGAVPPPDPAPPRTVPGAARRTLPARDGSPGAAPTERPPTPRVTTARGDR